MTLEELLDAESVCYWDYKTPREVKLTGRVIMSPTPQFTYVEIKTGWFSKKWVQLPLLDVITVENRK